MEIFVYNQQKDITIRKLNIKKIVRALLQKEHALCDEISIHFVTIRKIQELHLTFFQDSTPTDCITVPVDVPGESTPYFILGEIFVCPKVAREYAKEHQLDPYEETILYVIHGILHLLGLDDITQAQKKVMQKKEKECMDFIKQQGLL